MQDLWLPSAIGTGIILIVALSIYLSYKASGIINKRLGGDVK